MKYVCCLITVREMAPARHFYETLLGQEVINDFGENVGFTAGFALHQIDHYRKLVGLDLPAGVLSGELYFEEDEVDAAYERLLLAGVEFVHPVVTQPWGQRVFRCLDPDGHIVEIGESLEQLVRRLHSEDNSPARIAEITGMVQGYIESIINNEASR
jgi:catechol 2,3-dioxygenase-like lactoylglutathione lyase family enzyme